MLETRADHLDGPALGQHALIAALHPDSSAVTEWVGRYGDRIDWVWVLQRARAHKVAGLVAARLQECGLAATLDAELQARLAAARQEALQCVTTTARTLPAVTDGLERHGIPFLVVKGSVLAEHVYRDPAMRRFYDLDLVVHREAVPPAEAALRALGYRLGQVEELLGMRPRGADESKTAEALTRWFYERFHYELAFDAPRDGGLLAIDLHWDLAPAAYLRARPDELWAQTMTIDVGGTAVRTLNPPATLIYLAVHASVCSFGGVRLLHVCDVAWVATRWADRCEGVWELATQWHAHRRLAAMLETVERALGVPIPAPLRPPRPRRARRWPVFGDVSTAAFLVNAGRESPLSGWRRRRAEVAWNVAMRCLGWNLLRMLRVRMVRLRWALRRRPSP